MAYINSNYIALNANLLIGEGGSYNEGYKDGQNSMVDSTKIIEKTASGIGSVTVDDVSEIPHEIKVQLSSDTITDFSGVTLKKYPNNLFATPLRQAGLNISYGSWVETDLIVRPIQPMYITEGTYTLFTDEDKQFKVWFYDRNYYNQSAENLKTWQTNKVTFTITEPRYILFEIQKNGEVILPSDIKVLVLEKGETITEETIEVNADGTATVKSCSPNMVLATDNASLIISIDYHESWSKRAEYDSLFDNITKDVITHKQSMFAGWEPEFFKPRKIIQFWYWSSNNSLNSAFASFGLRTKEGTEISLPKIFEQYGGGLNTRLCNSMQYLFNESNITDGGILDLTKLSTTGLYRLCYKSTRMKRIVLSNITNTGIQFMDAFYNCTALEELFFENSTIGQSLDAQYSPLCKDSILSVFTALADTATSKSVTFNLNAVNTAFETSEGAADGSESEEWLNLVATKPNWTISLA